MRSEGGEESAVGEIEDAADSAVPDGREFSEWPKDAARLVVANAERWDLASHPAPFAGKLVKGLISALR